jgi:hypothetical protein
MATDDQIRQWKHAGAEIRRAREHPDNRPADVVKRTRELAAATAEVCADCFTPLAPAASVTLVRPWVEHVPAHYHPLGHYIPAHERRLDVPICLACWLSELASPWWHLPGLRQRGHDRIYIHDDKEVRRLRCEGCERPLRVVVPKERRWWRRGWTLPASSHGLTLRERCCCETCLHKATLKRANERRRVRHTERACAVCGEMFVPTQSTAKTCSNRCRQQLHRNRHAGGRR